MADLTNHIQPRPPISNYSPLHQISSDSCSPPKKQSSSSLLPVNLEEPGTPKSSSKKSKQAETPNSNSKKNKREDTLTKVKTKNKTE